MVGRGGVKTRNELTRDMDILAFSDTHGDHDALADLAEQARHADIAVCAGDITNYGDDLDAIIERLADFPVDVYLVHGNHEQLQAVNNLCLVHDGVINAHRTSHAVNDHTVVGYGGEGFSFTTEDFETFIHSTDLPDDNIILVTHQPPHNTSLDEQNGRHTGNNSFRKFIDAHPVVLSISGHLHENFGAIDATRGTRLINPGPGGILLAL